MTMIEKEGMKLLFLIDCHFPLLPVLPFLFLFWEVMQCFFKKIVHSYLVLGSYEQMAWLLNSSLPIITYVMIKSHLPRCLRRGYHLKMANKSAIVV